MAVQDNQLAAQLAALDKSRDRVARLRNEHMLKREEHHLDLQDVDVALGSIETRLRNLIYQSEECHKSAKASSSAWLGMKMPESIIEELNEKNREIDGLNARIKQAQDSHATLTERRKSKSADYNLEDQDQAKLEAELKEIDRRIAEIRGF